MRRLLVLVLCLLMPLQGYASAGGEFAPPCPMQGMMEMDVDTGFVDPSMGDCCNDLATFERTGEPCKSDKGCAAPTVWSSLPDPLGFLVATNGAPPPMAWRSWPPLPLAPHWRPPSSI